MRRTFARILILSALGACAIGPAMPSRVTLDRSLLTVAMSDGSTCRGPAPAQGAETGWSGMLTGCPWAYAYGVEIDPRTNPVRFIFEEIFGDRLIGPLATVTITDGTGRARVFQSPEPFMDDRYGFGRPRQ
jgi:hypothetical protein